MVEEGRSEKLSDQSEILLHCRVDISDCDTDSFMGTEHCNRGPLLCPIPCATSFPMFLQNNVYKHKFGTDDLVH